jgi:ABC-type transporter Mla MlaB component
VNVGVQVDRELEHATILLSGAFDLAHSIEVVDAVQRAEAHLAGCHSAVVNLARVKRIDGTGAVLLARLLDRLAANGCTTDVAGDDNPEAARLLALYRRHRIDHPSPPSPKCSAEVSKSALVEAAHHRRIAAQTPEVRSRRGQKQSQHRRAELTWDPKSQPNWLTESFYEERIQPLS